MEWRALPWSEGCFCCGAANRHGLQIKFETDGERIRVRFTPHAGLQGYNGILHGGVQAAMLDEAMGWAPTLFKGRFCVAVELNVEYRRSAPVNQPLELMAWSTGHDRRIWTAEGEIRSLDGDVYSRGRGRYVPISLEETRAVCGYLLTDETSVQLDELLKPGPAASHPNNM